MDGVAGKTSWRKLYKYNRNDQTHTDHLIRPALCLRKYANKQKNARNKTKSEGLPGPAIDMILFVWKS